MNRFASKEMDPSERVTELKNYLLAETRHFLRSNGDRSSFAEKLQTRIIQTGEDLEAFGYRGTKIIETLETLCELLYWFSTGRQKLEEFTQILEHQCRYLENTFFWCVPEGAYDLSIAAIIKNEPDILEWIAFHRVVGVQHFYIFDNGSTDGLEQKLTPLMENGTVTYIPYPGSAMQDRAYNEAVRRFRYDTKWLAIIDGDEYLFPMEEGELLPALLDRIVADYHAHPFQTGGFAGAVGVNWRDYGTSGHKTPPEGLCIENYLYRAEDDYPQNVHIKTILNPRVTLSVENPHCARYRDGYYCISEHGTCMFFSYFYDGQCQRIRINHYFSKSEEQLVAKNRRGWPVGDLHRDDTKELAEATGPCNQIYDPILTRYVPAVREALKGASPAGT